MVITDDVGYDAPKAGWDRTFIKTGSTWEIVDRVKKRNLQLEHRSTILVHIGSFEVAARTTNQFLREYPAMIKDIANYQPRAKIICSNILPRPGDRGHLLVRIQAFNKIIN